VAHYSHKQRWSGPAVRFADRPVPLAALFLVTRGARASFRPLTGREAIMALIRYSMVLDAHDVAAARKGFDLAAAVVSRVKVERLVLPHGAKAIDALCREIAGQTPKR
jgi:hypothetical protein